MSKIFLSIPILEKPHLKMMYSMYQSVFTCTEHSVRLHISEQDSLISRVRNNAITKFIESDSEYFFSLDSDLEIVNCYKNNNIFTKLISHDVDFVGGLYPLKSQTNERKCASIPCLPYTSSTIPFDSGLIEMIWLSSGCWCIKRSAIEKMIEAYPGLIYDGDDIMAGKKVYGLCIPEIEEIETPTGKKRKYMSEDWAMVNRWRKIGGKVYADTSIVLNHFGQFPYCLWNLEIKKI